MDSPGLRVVEPAPRDAAIGACVAVLGAAILGAAATSAVVGVSLVRRPIAPLELARGATSPSADPGTDDPRLRAALLELRRNLGARPLDARSRAVYADLLFGASRRLADTQASAAHARLAARLAPVTVPVAHLSATVLAKSGAPEEASGIVNAMFGYDAAAAAELLARIEPFLAEPQVQDALPADPSAWLAWSDELRRNGRAAEADAWVTRTLERWRDHLPAIRALAVRYASLEDWTALAALLPVDWAPPEDETGAPLFALRARARVALGDPDGARDDIAHALALDGRSTPARAVAGDVFYALGDVREARRQWTRGLHSVPEPETRVRIRLLARLARLEDQHGQPAQALRWWRALLALDPEHAEARRRAAEIAGH